MIFIKPYTVKLLKDLDNIDLWEHSFFAVKHKKEGFEVRDSIFASNMIWGVESLKFNVLERLLIEQKVRDLKEKLAARNELPIPEYFKV